MTKINTMRTRLISLPPLELPTTTSPLSSGDGDDGSVVTTATSSRSPVGVPETTRSTPNKNSDDAENSCTEPEQRQQSEIASSPCNTSVSVAGSSLPHITLWPEIFTLPSMPLPPTPKPPRPHPTAALSSASSPSRPDEQEFSFSDFLPIKTIGSNGARYATVKQMLHRPTNRMMAVKTMPITPLNAVEVQREIANHRRCSDESIRSNVVRLYGTYVHDGLVGICTEFMDSGSFDEICKRCGRVPEPIVAQVALAVVQGLHFLKRKCDVMHRDIKPANILANNRGDIKLCDLGLSTELVQSMAKSCVGSRRYMSPEVLACSNKYTVQADIWSLGITLIELALGECPVPPLSTDEQRKLMSPSTATAAAARAERRRKTMRMVPLPLSILQYYRENAAPTILTDYFSIDFKYYVDQCLRKDPTERPELTALMLTHRFIQRHSSCTKNDVALWLRSTTTTSSSAATAVASSPSELLNYLVPPLLTIRLTEEMEQSRSVTTTVGEQRC